MNCWKNKVSSLLYKNGQIGLVFFLFTIILLHLPSVIYGSVFLAPITGNEADYYSKFGAWFTAIGAIFTIINTIVLRSLGPMKYNCPPPSHNDALNKAEIPFLYRLKGGLFVQDCLHINNHFQDVYVVELKSLHQSSHHLQ